MLKHTNVDGRFLIIASLSIYFLILFFASFFSTYYDFWNAIGVPARPYPFGDLRVITSGLECYRQGYDVYVNNPCNPWPYFGEFNYPQIWLLLAKLGIKQSHTLILGIAIVLLFFSSVLLIVGRLSIREGLLYSLILCSPSVMLGVERANNDLIIFILLAIALLLIRSALLIKRLIAYLVIVFAACLKLYPLFGLLITVKEGKRHFLLINSFLAGLFGIYLVSQFENIKQVNAATPQVNYWSYGFKIMFHILWSDVVKVLERLGVDKKELYGWLPDTGLWQFLSLKKLFVLAIALTGLFVIGIILKRFRPFSLSVSSKPELLDAFRIGASVYIGTFLLANSWAYRLTFLIFTIPQLLVWQQANQPLTTASRLALLGIVLTMWLKTLSFGGWIVYIDQTVNWLLFGYYLYAVILTLPDWVKSWFSLSKPTSTVLESEP